MTDPLAVPPYTAIRMPIDSEGKGPASEIDTVTVLWQVWDSLNHTVSEHTTQEEAIRAVKIASERTSITSTMCISLLTSILKEEVAKPHVDPLQEWADRINQKESDRELTFKEAPINTYLQLVTESKKRGMCGRIVLKPHKFVQIDDEDITWFADTLTWIRVKDIENCIVVRVSPKFNNGPEFVAIDGFPKDGAYNYTGGDY